MKEKLKNWYNRITDNGSFHGIYGVLILLLITGMMILHIALPDRSFSDSEKRVLEPLPAVNAASLTDGLFS